MTDLSAFSVPWHGAGYVSQLDLGYYWHSAQKLISPVVFDVSGNIENIHSDLSELTQPQRTQIAGMIYQMFNRKWTRLWEVYEIEYNPINNYSMTETETIDNDIQRNGTDTGTVSNDNTGTITDNGTEGGESAVAHTGTVSNQKTQGGTVTTDTDTTVTDNGTEGGTRTTTIDTDTTNGGTVTNAGTNNTLDGIFGFNSSVSVGSDTSDVTSNNTRTDNLTGTEDTTNQETRNLTNSNTRVTDGTETETRNLSDSDTQTLNNTDTTTRNLTDSNTRTLDTNDTETRNLAHAETVANDTERNLQRQGSTGIYSPQTLLNEELELWQWNFFKTVFEDIDSILCLSIY